MDEDLRRAALLARWSDMRRVAPPAPFAADTHRRGADRPRVAQAVFDERHVCVDGSVQGANGSLPGP